ncbi:MAG TPA: response regulator transcription factor [Gaiellaceae bacterium]|nr:response regulator transcription factor [Gaiellaceae bacterium]
MGTAPLILVADPDPACGTLVSGLLARIGLEATEARTGAETLEIAQRVRPALALLEVNLAETSGYEVCRELRDEFGHDIFIILLSGERTTPSDRVAGLLVGADDYIVKPFNRDELLARVRAGLRRIRPGDRPEDAPAELEAPLTPREQEVLSLLARGLNQRDIASKLFISPKTVGGHIQRVMAKLDVHSRAQAVALAHERGLADFEAHDLGLTLVRSSANGAAAGAAPL